MPLLTPDDVDTALDQATQAVPELGMVTRLDSSAWVLALASGHELLAEWADEPPRLVLTAPLGQPEPEHELAASRAALLHNAQWPEHGPLRVGRDDEGEWLLMTDLPASALQGPELPDQLLRFGAEQALWTLALQRIGQAASPGAAANPSAAPPMGPASALRA
ncbi:type III secretion system chaperone [Hydrogenophaga crocea]|uniref:Type III secretion system chaperone n=1 Tax=Hydrogenophaga crocea TaxID=2716225 RepID=A0A6G8IDR3_9BURK|nr:type III secretion system chaperone [Hydrogenophaga crocea]QIM51292.1 type III secretion system chaperone [Hydrogenophaga crocea]